MHVIESRGFPLAALRVDYDPQHSKRRWVHPIWTGLLADTVIFAAIVAAARWLLIYPRRFLVESARLRRGECMLCGYDLQYNFSPGCPECGWRRAPAPADPPTGGIAPATAAHSPLSMSPRGKVT
jgi:hypothetical protein